ncbi:MAG TPA: hypothetical protein VFH47_01955 [Candidatus Thermoplasmatota archaeon]|nr:hypothetical protein [Candidatus Thermoplasmatota archaeon]
MRVSLAARDPTAKAGNPETYRHLPADSCGTLGTGVARLDTLLGGGYPAKSATLLHGPPFVGKEQLLLHGIVAAVRAGVPATVVLGATSAAAMSDRLRRLEPMVRDAERGGLLRYVDLYSPLLGADAVQPHPCAVATASVNDLGRADQLLLPATPPDEGVGCFVAVDSASALLVDAGPQAAFLALRSVVGRTTGRGGVALLCLDAGMHPEQEVQLAKHLCTGMVELRRKGETLHLRVEGHETTFLRPGWVEYEFSSRSFRLTGSFACRSIP